MPEHSMDPFSERGFDAGSNRASITGYGAGGGNGGTAEKRVTYLISWDGPEDSENPKNWSSARKITVLLIVASFTLISPLSSSMVAPSTNVMSKELNITNEFESEMVLSVFVLAYAIGPLFLAPLSEHYGRVPVLQLANLFYLIFNAACGFAKNKEELIAFRFLAGIGGSAPIAIGSGVVVDMFGAEQLARAIAVYGIMPLLGPAIGPIAGGFITEYTTWRWSFYATAIVDAALMVFSLFFLRETHERTLLNKRVAMIRKDTGNDRLLTEWQTPENAKKYSLWTSLRRPWRLLATEPIVQILSLYQAFLYGIMYLVLATFANVWIDVYHESIGISGLNYISLGVGFIIGGQAGGFISKRLYDRFKAKNGGVDQPEFRVLAMMPAGLLLPLGLLLYGWSARYAVHWIVPNIGAAIFGAGTVVGYDGMLAYNIATYPSVAASSSAACALVRSLAGFGFPLFAPYLYNALGLGWGNSVLALASVVFVIPGPFILWRFGKKLRETSQHFAED